MWELLWLLLPVAAASGYWAGRRNYTGPPSAPSSVEIGDDYFRGLNFLLNEEPDKAIEVFISILEVDSSTVETHLALGKLFRRRGEVDRAIRIHQNLIARPTLSQTHHDQALIELGEDYLRSGLFDRAESIFRDMISSPDWGEWALRSLITIYEQEKDWHRAIDTCQRLSGGRKPEIRRRIAHYWCELGDEALAEGDSRRLSLQYARKALAADRECVRATILQGRIEMEHRAWRAALRAYRRVGEQDVDCLPEVLDALRQCHEETNDAEGFFSYLHQEAPRCRSVTPALQVTEYLIASESPSAGIAYLGRYLTAQPSLNGLECLVSLIQELANESVDDALTQLREIVAAMAGGRPTHRCSQCGFAGKSLHWQCPRCKSWDMIRPVNEFGEWTIHPPSN